MREDSSQPFLADRCVKVPNHSRRRSGDGGEDICDGADATMLVMEVCGRR